MTKHTWQFASRFRRNAFGWQSDKPILRIKEAVAEIKKIARTEPNLAAQGAVIFIEKVSASLMHVDSSSGALSAHLNAAIETLAKLIAAAPATLEERQIWLKRLWKAMEEDEMPYLEYLSDFWGELCAGPDLASQWANEFFPYLEFASKPGRRDAPYFRGTPACFSALFAAQRYDEILELVSRPKFHGWSERRWGVRCLTAMCKTMEAIELAVSKPELNDPQADIARTCEDILLKAGLHDEAYHRFALKANQAMTHLARFRAIARKYSIRAPVNMLRDLVAEDPEHAGKWFAAAKDSGLYEYAIELVRLSPADPRTLIRAARDHRNSQPRFALESGLAALRWIAADYGYEITADEISAAYREVILAIPLAGADAEDIKRQIRDWISGPTRIQKRMREVLV
jgi:hypothetical protein